jgi:Fe-S-cluster containining protein
MRPDEIPGTTVDTKGKPLDFGAPNRYGASGYAVDGVPCCRHSVPLKDVCVRCNELLGWLRNPDKHREEDARSKCPCPTWEPEAPTELHGAGEHSNVKPLGGHCCMCLTLYWTFMDLATSYKSAIAGGTTFVRPATGETVPNVADILTIGPMIRLVGVCDENPLTGDKCDPPRKIWRCIHNRPDFTCAIYDKRPLMCRKYPGQQAGGDVSKSDNVCQYTYCQSLDCPGHPSQRTQP